MQLSKLHIYSMGQAAENKKLGSRELEVFPIEVASYVDGEITADHTVAANDGVDAFGHPYSDQVSSANSIRATWLSFGSNRMSAPDIRRGERIAIYRFADVDKYYWVDMNQDAHLRRLETVIYAFCNISTNDTDFDTLTPENSYYFEISTHTKQIMLRTNKSDGEPYAYDLLLNTKLGQFTIQDDNGNSIELDSAALLLALTNKEGTRVKLEGQNILMEAPNEILQRCKSHIVECETSVVKAKTSITHTTVSYSIKADELIGDIIASTFNGTVLANGMLTLAGGINAIPGVGTGISATFSIPFTSTAMINANGGIQDNGVSIGKEHAHTSSTPGSQTSPVTP